MPGCRIERHQVPRKGIAGIKPSLTRRALLYWDQASVLKQIGLLGVPGLGFLGDHPIVL
jgi:hypothetical protein